MEKEKNFTSVKNAGLREGGISVLEPVTQHNVEVEKKGLEVEQNIQKGWQEVTNKAIDTLSEIIKSEGKKGFSKLVLLLGVVLIIFIVTAYLAYNKTISGEAFTFFVGTISGYLIAYSLPRIQI